MTLFQRSAAILVVFASLVAMAMHFVSGFTFDL